MVQIAYKAANVKKYCQVPGNTLCRCLCTWTHAWNIGATCSVKHSKQQNAYHVHRSTLCMNYRYILSYSVCTHIYPYLGSTSRRFTSRHNDILLSQNTALAVNVVTPPQTTNWESQLADQFLYIPVLHWLNQNSLSHVALLVLASLGADSAELASQGRQANRVTISCPDRTVVPGWLSSASFNLCLLYILCTWLSVLCTCVTSYLIYLDLLYVVCCILDYYECISCVCIVLCG